MPDEVTLDVTTIEENVTVETTAGDVVEIKVLAPTGTAATVTVGTTTTGAAGTNASVTNSGTTSAAVLNFTIPQGDTGATGATGAAGPNSVTSATTSDGTANLSISNVTTATATVSSLLTANHIHGNLAGTLYTHVRTGEAVAKGDPVYVSGFHNGTSQPIVSKADASNPAKMPAIGVMDAGYAQNVSGANCVIAGTITSVDTDDFSINSPVYVGDGGGFSETIGTIPQQVGIVERSNQNNGAFVVTNNKVISSADISDFASAVEAIAPNAVTSATTSDGTASLDISNLTLSQDVTSGIQTKMTFTANPTAVGDGQQIIWQWYNGGSPVTTAAITTEATGSTSDKLLFKTSYGGSVATSLDLSNSLATFSGVVSSLGATYQTGSTFTYNGSTATAHRTALGLTTLATTTPAANVATFLATPSSANLAAAVTDETGSGSLVFAESPSLTSPTIGTSATFNATTYTYGAGAAAAHRTALGFVSKSKASSTSRSSTTTRTADPDLTFEIGANETWIFELSVLISQHASSIQVSSQLTSPSGALISGRALTGRDGGVAGTTLFQSLNAPSLISTRNGSHHITATVISSATAGTVAFAWAQETSSATASIVALGSYIQATRIS